MPYTASLKTTPLEQHIKHPQPISPSSSPESPKLLRTSTERLRLSRSHSPDHVRRHRRSPSFSKSFVVPAFEGSRELNNALNTHAAVRRPSPTLGTGMIPPGTVLSPPESNPSSSDEEQSYQQQEAIKLEYLEAAVRSMDEKREPSTGRKKSNEPQSSERRDAAALRSSMKPNHSASNSSLPRSKEGRKMSLRSYTVSATVQKQEEAAISSSPEDSGRDDEPIKRPPMVRKKSGELVRPALRPPMARRRPSSMPGTPTFSKAVHFDSQLEYIRHFVQLDKPLAVSAETSPVEAHDSSEEFPFGRHEPEHELELRLPNFPKNNSRVREKVQLENLFLSSDNTTLVGLVAVANLAYHKHVVARFTFDYWKTVSEVVAEYNHDIRRKYTYDGYDRFSFTIKLDDQANLESKTMFTCVRYNVNGQELWDNNNGMNYQADFVKTSKPKSEKRGLSISGSRPALPRSRTFASSTGRSLSMPRSIDDFSEFIDHRLSVESPESNGTAKPPSHDVDDDMDTATPVWRGRSTRQAFSTRYDFEASLSAAMRTKPTQDRTTLTARAKNEKGSVNEKQTSEKRGTGFTVEKAVPISQLSRQVAQSEYFKPSSLIHGKPHQDSSVYKELVDKYCFYGSSNNTTSLNQMATEGSAMNAPQETLSHSPKISPVSLPVPSPRRGSNTRSCSREPHTSSASGSSSRTASSSPISLGYSYHQSLQNNFFKEIYTPAVIGS